MRRILQEDVTRKDFSATRKYDKYEMLHTHIQTCIIYYIGDFARGRRGIYKVQGRRRQM